MSAALTLGLYLSRFSLPPGLSLLHGPWGVAIGVAGVALCLLAPARLHVLLLGCWFGLWLTAAWNELRSSAVTDGLVLGGIVPYSDADNFLREASRLAEGHNLTGWGSRRPLADAYLSGLLFLCGNRLRGALLLAGLFNAGALARGAAEVRRTLGWSAAVAWAWLMLVFCRRFAGDLVSEQAGIALGALGAALLLRSFSVGRRATLGWGCLLLGLALNARAGAFLVLPGVVAAAAWRWRASGGGRAALLSLGAVAAAFLLSLTFLWAVGSSRGRLMSNYHEHLYGMVFGGGWQEAERDIPNFGAMDEPDRIAEIDRRVKGALQADPWVLLRAAGRNWALFFGETRQALGPFSFFRSPDTEYTLIAFSAVGLLMALTTGGSVAPLLLATAGGLLLSVPFVPPPDADLMRAYAATMPLLFLLPVYPLSGWRAWAERPRPGGNPSPDGDGPKDLIHGQALLYLGVMLVLPLWARFGVHSPVAVGQRVVEGRPEMTLHLRRVDGIEFVSESAALPAGFGEVRADTFKANIFGNFRALYPGQAALLDTIARPGLAIVGPGSADAAFLVIDAQHLHDEGDTVVLHGRWFWPEGRYSPAFVEDSVSLAPGRQLRATEP